MQKSSTSSSRKCTRTQELELPPFTSLISQINRFTVGLGSWKLLPALRTLPDNHSASKYCDYYHDHVHNTKDFWVLKSFILKLIGEKHFIEFIA